MVKNAVQRHCSVGRGFEPPSMLVDTWSQSTWIKKAWLPCWLPKVSRCGTRGESEHTGNKAHKRVIYSGFKTPVMYQSPYERTYLCLPKKNSKKVLGSKATGNN